MNDSDEESFRSKQVFKHRSLDFSKSAHQNSPVLSRSAVLRCIITVYKNASLKYFLSHFFSWSEWPQTNFPFQWRNSNTCIYLLLLLKSLYIVYQLLPAKNDKTLLNCNVGFLKVVCFKVSMMLGGKVNQDNNTYKRKIPNPKSIRRKNVLIVCILQRIKLWSYFVNDNSKIDYTTSLNFFVLQVRCLSRPLINIFEFRLHSLLCMNASWFAWHRSRKCLCLHRTSCPWVGLDYDSKKAILSSYNTLSKPWSCVLCQRVEPVEVSWDVLF